MDRRLLLGVCCACCLLGVAACATPPLTGIPLQWTPRKTLAEYGPVDISGRLVTLKIHIEPFVDTRTNPALIAENREQAKPRLVTTSTNVATFVTDHVRQALATAGLQIVDAGADFTLTGEIKQFFVTETSEYLGHVSMVIHLKNAAGAEVWTGVVSGAADDFGRSYHADNYYETISDMILQATYNLLANSSFHGALQHG